MAALVEHIFSQKKMHLKTVMFLAKLIRIGHNYGLKNYLNKLISSNKIRFRNIYLIWHDDRTSFAVGFRSIPARYLIIMIYTILF